MADAEAARPRPRSILKTAARIAHKASAQRAALLERTRREVLLKLLLLGGEASGKSSLVRALAGDRPSGSGGSSGGGGGGGDADGGGDGGVLPTVGPETTTLLAATFRDVPVLLHAWEVGVHAPPQPLEVAGGGNSAGAHALPRPPAAGPRRLPPRLHTALAFSGVHAALVLLDGGGGGGGSEGRGPLAALADVDACRDELERRLPARVRPPAPGGGAFPLYLVVTKADAAVAGGAVGGGRVHGRGASAHTDDSAVTVCGLNARDLASYAAAAGYRGVYLTSSPLRTGGAGAASVQRLLAAVLDDALEYWGYTAPPLPAGADAAHSRSSTSRVSSSSDASNSDSDAGNGQRSAGAGAMGHAGAPAHPVAAGPAGGDDGEEEDAGGGGVHGRAWLPGPLRLLFPRARAPPLVGVLSHPAAHEVRPAGGSAGDDVQGGGEGGEEEGSPVF